MATMTHTRDERRSAPAPDVGVDPAVDEIHVIAPWAGYAPADPATYAQFLGGGVADLVTRFGVRLRVYASPGAAWDAWWDGDRERSWQLEAVAGVRKCERCCVDSIRACESRRFARLYVAPSGLFDG